MPVPGTQSFVHQVGACLHRPKLLGLELLWRWGFGIPALALIGYEATKVASAVPLAETGMDRMSVQFPLEAVQSMLAAGQMLMPPAARTLLWLGPLLAIGWSVASGLGRTAVLRRIDPQMRRAPGTLISLQLLRIVSLCVLAFGWWLAIRAAAASTLNSAEPDLVGYFTWIIVISLTAFLLWALGSWTFSTAPLLAMLEGAGLKGSMTGSLRLGPMTGKLIEINLSLGIAKLALAALAMIFSSIPLPFSASMTGMHLYLWWAAVSVVYMAAADSLQIARLAVFTELWHVYRPKEQRIADPALRLISQQKG